MTSSNISVNKKGQIIRIELNYVQILSILYLKSKLKVNFATKKVTNEHDGYPFDVWMI